MEKQKLTRKKVRLKPQTRIDRFMAERKAQNDARAEASKTAKLKAVIVPNNPEDLSEGGAIINITRAHDDFRVEGALVVDAEGMLANKLTYQNGVFERQKKKRRR